LKFVGGGAGFVYCAPVANWHPDGAADEFADVCKARHWFVTEHHAVGVDLVLIQRI
jgi:hypothetical protein